MNSCMTLSPSARAREASPSTSPSGVTWPTSVGLRFGVDALQPEPLGAQGHEVVTPVGVLRRFADLRYGADGRDRKITGPDLSVPRGSGRHRNGSACERHRWTIAL